MYNHHEEGARIHQVAAMYTCITTTTKARRAEVRRNGQKMHCYLHTTDVYRHAVDGRLDLKCNGERMHYSGADYERARTTVARMINTHALYWRC